jgi:hypothetical protein
MPTPLPPEVETALQATMFQIIFLLIILLISKNVGGEMDTLLA